LQITDNDISDACLDIVAGLPNLKLLDVEQTKVTVAGIERLRQMRPNLEIRAHPEK